MKFLVDAQLPRRMAHWLVDNGHDAIHTLDLPRGNATTDDGVCRISTRDKRVVITKDRGFADSITLSGTPYKLLLVTTGNMSNSELERLFERNLSQLEESLTRFDFVELGRGFVVSHL